MALSMVLTAGLFFPLAALADGRRMSLMYINGIAGENATAEMNKTESAFDAVSPLMFEVNLDGSLRKRTIFPEFVSAMQAQGMKVVPHISNHWGNNTTDPKGNEALAQYQQLAADVAAEVANNNLDGLNVDIENADHTHREQYTDFVRLLRQYMPAGKELSVAVAANPNALTTYWHGSYDYAALAQYADYLTIMGYDEYSMNDQRGAGPVASASWVESAIKYGTERVNPDKLVLTIPLFGRAWSEDGRLKGVPLRLNQIDTLMKQFNGTFEYIEDKQSPKATLIIPEGAEEMTVNNFKFTPGTYTIWYENDQSIQYKYELAKKHGLKGVAFWALYGNVEGFWGTFNKWQDDNTVAEAPKDGWMQEGGKWKYYKNGRAATGWITDGGKRYFLNEQGEMKTGWVADGVTASGDTRWYLLSGSGAMLTGWHKSGVTASGAPRWYLLSDSGEMLTGWHKRGSWYYMDGSGAMQTGWFQDGSTWYYANSSGAMLTGTQRISGKTYRFASSGAWIS